MLHAYQPKLTGKQVGVVFGTFAPLHQGHLDVIMRAKKECDGGALVIVSGYDNDRGEAAGMPHNKRYRYVREFFADDDLIAVYGVNETELNIPAYPNGWEPFYKEVIRLANEYTNFGWLVFYVSEQEYYDWLTSRGVSCVLLDRTENPISGTAIRENPIKNWDKITFPFRRFFSTNILILGTASEGKTTLTQDLGKYFNAPYSYEYARQYMAESGVADWELDGADYFAFLDGQYQLNKRLINSPANQGLFFADTDSMTTRAYAEYYSKDPELALTDAEFQQIAVAADALTAKCHWDKIYLVCPRGVYVDDHSRYMGHAGMNERQELYEIMVNNIKASGNWDKVTILDGGYYNNFKKVVSDVKEIIEHGKMG